MQLSGHRQRPDRSNNGLVPQAAPVWFHWHCSTLHCAYHADKPSSSFGAGSARGRGYGGASSSSKPKQEEGPGAAQQRFGNAKSISSSAFHGQDNQESEYEKQQRLQQFQVGAGGA